MPTLTTRQSLVKDFARSRNWIESRTGLDPQRVVIFSPGPPGVGKSYAATQSILAYGGRVVEPSHDQASERHAEARHMIKTNPNLADRTTRHIEGMGRRCLWHAEDEWSTCGWAFGDVACQGCPKKQECPSMRQFWQIPDASFGVHTMVDWDRGNVLVVDEMPSPVPATTWDLDEVYRLCAPVWPSEVEVWRRPIEAELRRVLDALTDEAFALPDIEPHGTRVFFSGLARNRAFSKSLDAVVEYFDNFKIPTPDPDSVRKGLIRPHQWPHGNLAEFFRALWYEVHGVAIPDRGRPETAAVWVFGSKGKVREIKVQRYLRWSPPKADMIINDSLAEANMFIYEKMLPGCDIKKLIRHVPVTPEGVELVQYDTHAFTRSRSLFPSGKLKKPGIHARIRGIRALLYKALREHPRNAAKQKPVIGIIDHKAALEDCGFDFDEKAVLSIGDHDKRMMKATSSEMEALWQEVERRCLVVVGYHGGVVGTNKFNGCRVTAIFGDPYGHIGMLAEEARCLGVAPQRYIDNRTFNAAYQEIFRARLLDTDKDNPKTVLYFGKKAPPIPGLGWKKLLWAEGGRIPSKLAHRVTAGLWRMVGAARPFFGGISDAIAGLHATLIGYPLLELRETGVNAGEMSHSEQECYRRTAKTVALEAGYSHFFSGGYIQDTGPKNDADFLYLMTKTSF